MVRRALVAVGVLALVVSAAACRTDATQDASADPTGEPMFGPVEGYVTDMEAFDAFIAQRPTPEQFRARYPDVSLLLPGALATKEFRTNNSRYFARLGDDGHIVGGRFL